jgi:hypothetical protein
LQAKPKKGENDGCIPKFSSEAPLRGCSFKKEHKT